MNKPDRSTFTPLDFNQWFESGTLELQPKFQRREVWSTAKKCYLIDTLLVGMPVPPIFLRVGQSSDRKRTVREIVDGQQRVKAVLDFIAGKYALSKLYASKHKAAKFSGLSEAQQDAIRQYAFICEVFHGISDAEVLEIFARVNTYSVPLNQQELLNGKYFGYFKSLAFSLAYEHLEFWRRHSIFSETAIARMSEVELTSELLALIIGGTQHKKDTLESFYQEYDDTFDQCELVAKKFRSTIDFISHIFGDELKDTEFRRPAFFYTLFSTVLTRMFPGASDKKAKLMTANETGKARDRLLRISEDISQIKEGRTPAGVSMAFANACLKSTDKKNERLERLNVISKRVFG